METKQSIFPPLPQYQTLGLEELVRRLEDNSSQVRTSALAALGANYLKDGLRYIVAAIRNERNRKTPWFGFITVSWAGVVVLLETGDALAQQEARMLLQEWDNDEKQHLRSWLKDFPEYTQALDN